jgi:hypothetical protein
MAKEGFQILAPYPAAADLSGDQYKIVEIDASEEIDLAGAGLGSGILIDDPEAGQNGSVCVMGYAKVVAAGAINAGIRFTADANGLAVAAGAGDDVVGMTLREAGAANQVIECIVAPSYRSTT